MSYPFEYKEVEKNLAEVGVLPYSSEGMRFIKFIYIKVSDVIHDFKNPARENAILEGDVTNIENIIKSGNYRGFAFVPPVVNEKGVLIAGHHRLEGHIGEDEEYMWVGVRLMTIRQSLITMFLKTRWSILLKRRCPQTRLD